MNWTCRVYDLCTDWLMYDIIVHWCIRFSPCQLGWPVLIDNYFEGKILCIFILFAIGIISPNLVLSPPTI